MNLTFYNPINEKLSSPILEEIFTLNENNKPALGGLESLERLKELYDFSMLCGCSFFNQKLIAFCLLMDQSSNYDSPNYSYFKAKYDEFLYIDRVAVQADYQRRGTGTLLYENLYRLSKQRNIPLCCEVNTFPLNQQSLDFHFKNKFQIIDEVDFGKKKVAMLVKQP